jgi:hypothetical protein
MSGNQVLPTHLADAKALALDADSHRFIAALASSAVKTVDHAAWQSPRLATRLAELGALAANKARMAATAAAASSEEADKLLRNAGLDCEIDDAAKQILSMAQSAVHDAFAFSREAEDCLQSIGQACLVLGNGNESDIPIQPTTEHDVLCTQAIKNQIVW